MCWLGLTFFLALSLPFTWADDYYEAVQTPDPSDDFYVLTADVYMPCDRQATLQLEEAPARPAEEGTSASGRPADVHASDLVTGPAPPPSSLDPSLLYVLQSLQC